MEEEAPSSLRKRKNQEDTKKTFEFAYLHVPGPEADHHLISERRSATGSGASPALGSEASASSSASPGVESHLVSKEKRGEGDADLWEGEFSLDYSLHDVKPCWTNAAYNSVRAVRPRWQQQGGREDDQLWGGTEHSGQGSKISTRCSQGNKATTSAGPGE